MSKKYRLIKRYPTLPKCVEVGTVVYQSSDPNITSYANIIQDSSGKDVQAMFTRQEVEDYPEFWEKVEETYEILTLKGNATGWIKKYDPSDDLSCRTIHSVKRLSDGEIFTVGDKVTNDNWDLSYSIKEIIKLEKEINLLLDNLSGYVRLSHVDKYEKPVFTTEDGVDIYVGDSFWFIKTWEPTTYNVNEISSAHRNSGGLKDTIYFSTKQKAKEWVDKNEPRYSKADIEEVIDELYSYLSPSYVKATLNALKKKFDL